MSTMLETKPQQELQTLEPEQTPERKKGKAVWTILLLAFVAIAVLAVLFLLYFWKEQKQKTVDDNLAAYQEQVQETNSAAYDRSYDHAYQQAMEEFGISGDVLIEVGRVQAISELEVLEINLSEYAIRKNDEGNTVWLSIPVQGVYAVNLEQGEYLVDQARATVTVRLPDPQLTNMTLDYAHEEQLLFTADGVKSDFIEQFISLFKDDAGNSYADGRALYDAMHEEVYENARIKMNTDPDYLQTARTSAVQLVEQLVKQVNSDIPGLTVIVEFME